MTDKEIRDRRAGLEKLRQEIDEEWKAYDARYPVEPGAYKPTGYDHIQLRFAQRSQEVSGQLVNLPATNIHKLGCALVILAVLGGLVWLASRFFAKGY